MFNLFVYLKAHNIYLLRIAGIFATMERLELGQELEEIRLKMAQSVQRLKISRHFLKGEFSCDFKLVVFQSRMQNDTELYLRNDCLSMYLSASHIHNTGNVSSLTCYEKSKW